jgi:hypothetical protein
MNVYLLTGAVLLGLWIGMTMWNVCSASRRRRGRRFDTRWIWVCFVSALVFLRVGSVVEKHAERLKREALDAHSQVFRPEML